MRIAFVTGNLNLGGTTTFLLNLCRTLTKRNIPNTIVALEPQHPMFADFEEAGIDVQLIESRPRIFEDVVKWGWNRCRDFKADHVIASLGYSSFEVARHAPAGVTRFAMIQSDDPRVYQGLEQYAPYLSGLVGVSQRICDNAASMPGFKTLTVYHQSYGIPVPQESVLARRTGAHPDRPVKMLYLGRLYREQKRVHLFPEIWNNLEQFPRPIEWTIAGDGNEKEWLMKNLVSCPSRKVTFAGHVEYARVPELLLQHDIFLLPSDYEGLPLSLLEAMAHGVVPVVSKLPSGVSEVITPDCGRLVEVSDTAGYAKAIIELASDLPKLRTLSQNSANRVRIEYSMEAMTDRWIHMLESCNNQMDNCWPDWREIETYLPQKNRISMLPALRPLRRIKKRLFPD